jgi:hypothetical protein
MRKKRQKAKVNIALDALARGATNAKCLSPDISLFRLLLSLSSPLLEKCQPGKPKLRKSKLENLN